MSRLAKSLDTLRTQVNAAHPGRSRDSDGWIGDTAHSARTSDHNPDDHGVVHAIDITHDPAGGFDSYAFAEMLRQRQDKRIKYVISNRRIFSGEGQGQPPWVWRKYTGTNPHNHHVHVSVRGASHEDDTTPWDMMGSAAFAAPVSPVPPAVPKTIRRGAMGTDVAKLQAVLITRGARIKNDGDFGAATVEAVKVFQRAHGLVDDGVVGPQTWTLLLSTKG